MYEKPRVNVKVERGSTFTFTRGFSYMASILIYARKASSSLRPYARKNYATVEIHLNYRVAIAIDNLTCVSVTQCHSCRHRVLHVIDNEANSKVTSRDRKFVSRDRKF